MAWVSVHQNLKDHRKLRKLYKTLKTSKHESMGILVFLWMWSLDNTDKTGKLEDISPEEIADAVDYKGNPIVLIDSLQRAGFIDVLEDGTIYIHDWYDFNKPWYDYQDRKAKDRERKRGNSGGSRRKDSEENPVEIPLENPAENRAEFHDSHKHKHKHKQKEKDLSPPKNGDGKEEEREKISLPEIFNGMDSGLIEKAVKMSAGKLSPEAYVKTVLTDWNSRGFKKVSDLPANVINFKQPQHEIFERREYTDAELEAFYVHATKPEG